MKSCDYFCLCYRYESHSGGEREIQRTLLELLNQLDGFDSRGDVKVCGSTCTCACSVVPRPHLYLRIRPSTVLLCVREILLPYVQISFDKKAGCWCLS